MVTARPWGVTDLQLLADGSYRFTAVILKSLGPTKIRGCRYVMIPQKHIYMPSYRAGANFVPMVTNTTNDTACLHKLVEKAIAKQVQDQIVKQERLEANRHS